MIVPHSSVIATFASHSAAESAVKQLQLADFDMKKLSIVGGDYNVDQKVVGYYNTGDRVKAWGKSGAFWGAIWSLLFGSAFFWIPGLGPLMVGGPLVSWIVAALEGAVIVGGISALSAALLSLGIPKDSVLKYETSIKAGKFVLIAHGSEAETSRAKAVLNECGADSIDSHSSAVSPALAGLVL